MGVGPEREGPGVCSPGPSGVCGAADRDDPRPVWCLVWFSGVFPQRSGLRRFPAYLPQPRRLTGLGAARGCGAGRPRWWARGCVWGPAANRVRDVGPGHHQQVPGGDRVPGAERDRVLPLADHRGGFGACGDAAEHAAVRREARFVAFCCFSCRCSHVRPSGVSMARPAGARGHPVRPSDCAGVEEGVALLIWSCAVSDGVQDFEMEIRRVLRH